MTTLIALTFENVSGWLDAAYQHPMPLEAQASVRRYLREKTAVPSNQMAKVLQDEVKTLFGQLVGAPASDIAFVPSATAGEMLILAGLDLLERGRIVTDDLHFSGSLAMYEQLRKGGVDVEVIASRDGVVDPERVERALASHPTDLLSLSWISAHNGFRHDLTQMAAMAHRHGALVYADIIQGVGAIPLDLPSTGIDFAATSSYKWLMGEIGAGFLWAPERTWPILKRFAFGLRQRDAVASDGRPISAAGLFETNSVSNIVLAALRATLPTLVHARATGTTPEREPLLDHLQADLRAMGIAPLTPSMDSTIVAFRVDRPTELIAAMSRGGVYATHSECRLRLAPSIHNVLEDMERFGRMLRAHIGRPAVYATS